MINHKMKILSIAMLLLSGCSGSSSSGTMAAPASAEDAITLESPVRLDQLGVLPASDSSAASFLLQLTNYSKDKYTLISARAVDLTTGKDSTLVSVASQACSTVSANGSCSIQLTPHTLQSADVRLEVTLKDQNGASKMLFQLIRISGTLNANDGGIVMLNDVDRIVTEDGNYSLSIPVVLGESYDDIKASNGSLICNTDGYQKGSSCTYQVSGKVSGTSAVVSTRLEGIKAGKTATVQEANTKVEVAKGAHLLLSHGVKINHPESSAIITVFNSGNIAATDIVASVNNSGLDIDKDIPNACGANLDAGVDCKIKVKVKSSTNTHGNSPLKVNYKDGTTDLATLTNVGYKVAAAKAGIEFFESNNTLSSAIVRGKERSVIVSVKNTGNSNLTNVSYHLAPLSSIGLRLEKGTTNGCDLSGATLAVDASCSLSIKYKPTAAQDKNTINLVLNGEHTDEHELAHSLIKIYGLSYSATEASAGNLVWTTTDGKGILSIQSNNNDSESAIWKLNNTLPADENLSASAVNVSLNPAIINGLKVTPIDAVKCAQGTTIAGNAACEYSVIYGPVSADQAEAKVKLKADYTLDTKKLASETSEFKLKADSIKTTKITVSVKTSGNTTYSGDGTLNNPWSFTAYSNKLLKLTYTFKNEGKLAADRFNVGASNLPSGAIIDSATTCKTGTETMRFESNNASCDVVVTIPDPELFSKPNSSSINLNSASLKLDLPYSYYDNGSLKRGSSDTKYVNFNRLWANVTHVVGGSQEDDSNYTILMTSNAQLLDSSIKYPLTIKPFLKNPITGVTLKECSVKNADETCINEIKLPKSTFIPGSKLIVTFKTSATGMDDSDAILSSVEAKTMAGNQVYTEAGLIYALNHLQAKSTITLESDIKLTKPWTMISKFENATFDGKGHKITGLDVQGSGRIGMINLFSYSTIKNLNLEGSVKNTSGSSTGLLAALTRGDAKISNCNFKSDVSSPGNYVGGVIGSLDGATIIESVTVDSKVKGVSYVGGFAGYSQQPIDLSNVRVKTNVIGSKHIGGLVGLVYGNQKIFTATNVSIESSIVEVKSGGSDVGGVFGSSFFDTGNRGTIIASNISVDNNIKANNATYVGGVVGNITMGSKLSNIVAKGTISTTLDPRDRKKGIASLVNRVSTDSSATSIKNAIDKVTIINGNKSYSSSLVTSESAVQFTADSANVFYALPAGVDLLTLLPNIGLVNPLSGTSVGEEKTFLIDKGFDFTNTWTIKKDSANNDIIGIKEDSIPQFPQW